MKKFLVCSLFLSAICMPGLAQQKIRVGAAPDSKLYEPMIAAIYKEVGLTPEFVYLPSERSLQNLSSGEIDADMGRMAGVVAAYPNTIETGETLTEVQLIGVVKKGFQPEMLKPADLKNYKVVHMIGAKAAENLVKKLGLNATQATAVPNMFSMVAAGRADVAITSGFSSLDEHPQFAATLSELSQPILTIKIVHVMNKKWAEYIPKIDAVVKKMKTDGRMAKLTTVH